MIRPYKSDDKEALLSLFWLLVPQYFAPSEEEAFTEYLEHDVEDYYVVEEDGQIVGGGGINYFADTGLARISWDFVHPDFRGRGIGSTLLLHRIQHIRKQAEIRTVEVRTSQMAYQFYEKLGFAVRRIEKDFWARGYDLYQMELDLSRPDK